MQSINKGGILLICALLLTASAPAQGHLQETEWSKTGNSYYIGFFGGESIKILGGQEIRRGGGIAFGYGKPEPAFRFRSVPAQLYFEASVDGTASVGGEGFRGNDRLGIDAEAYSRWRGRTRNGVGSYFDLGFGLYFTNPSFDLDSPISTVPAFGGGIAIRQGHSKNEILIGLRYRHISNAGTYQTNNGQNGIWLTAFYRF